MDGCTKQADQWKTGFNDSYFRQTDGLCWRLNGSLPMPGWWQLAQAGQSTEPGAAPTPDFRFVLPNLITYYFGNAGQ